MVRVYIIDEHPVNRQGLASVLESSTEFQVVGDAGSAQDAFQQIDQLKPDVVIMDAFKDGRDNVKEIKVIQDKYDKVKIFLLTDSDKENDFLKAIGAGVRGYFLKASEVSELLDAIRLVANDGTVVYSSKVAKLFDSTIHEAKAPDSLSQREKEILSIVARGHSNKDIANLCFVSEATVKAHMRRIMEKLGVKNRAEAVTIGIERGLLNINSSN